MGVLRNVFQKFIELHNSSSEIIITLKLNIGTKCKKLCFLDGWREYAPLPVAYGFNTSHYNREQKIHYRYLHSYIKVTLNSMTFSKLFQTYKDITKITQT